MKTMNKVLITSLLLSSMSVFAADGAGGGNGGGVHLCSNGKVQMYDVYEGFTRYNLSVTKDQTTVDGYINKALAKIHGQFPGVGARIAAQVKYLRQEGHLLLRSNLNMRLIDDANILVTDEGCRYAQLANWDDKSNNVLVKKEIFDRLDTANQAALYLHEAIYKVARDFYSARNSDDVRKTVAEAMDNSAEFSYFNYWSTWSRDSVVVDPRPQEVQVNPNGKSGHPEMSVHLGDIDLYDSRHKVIVDVSFDYSAAEEVKQSLKAELASSKAQVEALKAQMESIRSSRKKREIADQISDLERVQYPLNYRLSGIEGYQYSTSFRKDLKTSQAGSYRFEAFSIQDGVPQEAKKIKATYKLIIDGEVAYETTLNLQADINPVYYLDLSFTQNRK